MSDLIPKHGGFEKLRSYRVAEIIYDGTVVFCGRFIDKRSRTHDQMACPPKPWRRRVQAARSGKQNIAEGSLASATSKKTEIKLTGVARASLGELLLDYKDFLRQRGLHQWGKDDPESLAVRQAYKGFRERSDLSNKSDLSDKIPNDPYRISQLPAEIAANTLICLINQASYLIWQQMKVLEKEILEYGGFTEKIYRKRMERRNG